MYWADNSLSTQKPLNQMLVTDLIIFQSRQEYGTIFGDRYNSFIHLTEENIYTFWYWTQFWGPKV